MSKCAKERRDKFYAIAKTENYRARSAYKLLQLDKYLNILEVETAVDLCAAPGSWSQVLAKRVKQVISVDLAPIAPIENVIIIQGDITTQETANSVISSAGGLVDLVVCDGAPDVTGIHDLDEFVQAELINAAFGITQKILKVGGTFVSKIFRGELTEVLLEEFGKHFEIVQVVKPAASRASSMEAFLVCLQKMEKEGQGKIIYEMLECGMEDGIDADRTYE
eukprot:EST48458.1 FtsJ-like methyltransferase [Spironucleus salmonicida]